MKALRPAGRQNLDAQATLRWQVGMGATPLRSGIDGRRPRRWRVCWGASRALSRTVLKDRLAEQFGRLSSDQTGKGGEPGFRSNRTIS